MVPETTGTCQHWRLQIFLRLYQRCDMHDLVCNRNQASNIGATLEEPEIFGDIHLGETVKSE